MKKLDRNFFTRDALKVSKEVLGKALVHNSLEGLTSGKIVEVEAYIGPNDSASHAYLNRKTPRTKIQYKDGGYAYIYQIYGIHHCFNIVTGKKNTPEVVLIRALEPISGIALMIKRRGMKDTALKKIINLTNGPAKLCKAMGINKNHYGENLCEGRIFIIDINSKINSKDILASPRINIDYAGKARKYLWRFYLKNNPFVSTNIIKKSD